MGPVGLHGWWLDWMPGARAIHPIHSFAHARAHLASWAPLTGLDSRARTRMANITSGLRALEMDMGLKEGCMLAALELSLHSLTLVTLGCGRGLPDEERAVEAAGGLARLPQILYTSI